MYQDESGKPTALVQCKSWNERVVGVSLIRELLGAMAHEKIAKGYFMATSSFSADAKAFASANQITLIDGPMLLMMIERLPVMDQETLLAFAIEGDYQMPTCPSCGAKMVSITGSNSSHCNRLANLNLERDIKYCLTPNQVSGCTCNAGKIFGEGLILQI